jgi:hypothetical protein
VPGHRRQDLEECWRLQTTADQRRVQTWKAPTGEKRANVQDVDFAGATSTPTPTVNDIPLRQPYTANSGQHLNEHGSAHPDAMDNVTTATLTSIEERDHLVPPSAETSYSFLDAIDSRLDDFATADEEFRAYLEAQLGQYEFPIF